MFIGNRIANSNLKPVDLSRASHRVRGVGQLQREVMENPPEGMDLTVMRFLVGVDKFPGETDEHQRKRSSVLFVHASDLPEVLKPTTGGSGWIGFVSEVVAGENWLGSVAVSAVTPSEIGEALVEGVERSGLPPATVNNTWLVSLVNQNGSARKEGDIQTEIASEIV